MHANLYKGPVAYQELKQYSGGLHYKYPHKT